MLVGRWWEWSQLGCFQAKTWKWKCLLHSFVTHRFMSGTVMGPSIHGKACQWNGGCWKKGPYTVTLLHEARSYTLTLTLLHEARAGLTVHTVTRSKTAPSSPHNLSSPRTWVAAWTRTSWESKICSSSLKLVFFPGVNNAHMYAIITDVQPLSHNNYGTYFPSWLRIRCGKGEMLKLWYNHRSWNFVNLQDPVHHHHHDAHHCSHRAIKSRSWIMTVAGGTMVACQEARQRESFKRRRRAESSWSETPPPSRWWFWFTMIVTVVMVNGRGWWSHWCVWTLRLHEDNL